MTVLASIFEVYFVSMPHRLIWPSAIELSKILFSFVHQRFAVYSMLHASEMRLKGACPLVIDKLAECQAVLHAMRHTGCLLIVSM